MPCDFGLKGYKELIPLWFLGPCSAWTMGKGLQGLHVTSLTSGTESRRAQKEEKRDEKKGGKAEKRWGKPKNEKNPSKKKRKPKNGKNPSKKKETVAQALYGQRFPLPYRFSFSYWLLWWGSGPGRGRWPMVPHRAIMSLRSPFLRPSQSPPDLSEIGDWRSKIVDLQLPSAVP